MKEIKLTKGKVALVDDEDYEFLNKWKWNAHISWAKHLIYAERSYGRKTISMHRLILKITDPKIICDHKDGDGLNNQKSNLRIATPSQNSANSRPRKNFSSKYLGVHLNTKKGKWNAQIMKNGKYFYLGDFTFEIDAASAYDKAAIELHGEFANLNFPIENSNYEKHYWKTVDQENGDY